MMKNYIDYNMLRDTLKHAIDIIKEKLPESIIFIRYIPFCNMNGYEQYIVGHL
jgi:hypothetical protein